MLRELHLAWGDVHLVVSTHGIAVLVGVVAGAAVALRRAPDRDAAILLVAVAGPAALLGAAALHRLVHGAGSGPGGLSSMGGVAGLLLAATAVARATRTSLAALLDALAPGALLALAIGRVGCFLAGCCHGSPTTMPWGVIFPELGPPARHPLQLYSAVADLTALLRLPRGATPGTTARAVALRFAVARIALDTLRAPAAADVLPGGLTLAQVVALVVAIAAVAIPRPPLRLAEPSTMAPPRRRAAHGR
jgi:phosphatidylglycerol:prolipoprotein diacylglycerol transferase